MTRAVRVAVVASHPIQHFCPLYREVARDQRVTLKVFFASDAGARPYFDEGFGQEVSWGGNLTDGFEHEFLQPGTADIAQAVSTARIDPRLTDFAPDVVQIYGYADRLARRALWWSVRHRVPALMVSDSELVVPRSRVRQLVKRSVLPWILKLPTAFLTIGDENESYFHTYGVQRSRLLRSPIPIDSPSLDRLLVDRDVVREEERTSWGVSAADVVLLAVGKSIPRKRHRDIVEAVGQLPFEQRAGAVVVLAGGGGSSDDIQARASELGVRLVLLGFVPVPRLLRSYLGGDVLVHPSEADPHPLAVAEAVYAGLPVIVSDRVGSWGPTDDVQAGNGLRYPVGDVGRLAGLISGWIEDAAARAGAGAHSTGVGETRRLSRSASTFVDGVLEVAKR